MSKYLKLFETTSQYNEYITSINVVLPNVSVAKDAPLTVYFNPLPHDYSKDYLTLTALGDGEITITIPSDVNATHASYLSYSKDKSNWVKTAIDGTSQTIKIPVSSGEDVYLKGKAQQWGGSTSVSDCTNIQSSDNIIASGNIMSLLYGDYFKDKTVFPNGAWYTFKDLFENNSNLINAENLILPAMTLTSNCYASMFSGCSSLTAAPSLPATTLANSCYNHIFFGCSLLTTVPELPATELDNNCYEGMFRKCTSLKTAPTLPATTLSPYCYSFMFLGCTSLTTAPELPATKLRERCYQYMFYACSNLNNITMLATDKSETSCLYQWVKEVASTGTFTKAAEMTALPTGIDGIPSGWTVVNK